VIGSTAWHALQGTVPGAWTMGGVGLAALAANTAVLGLLWAYRQGDANMRSVWICSRNDVIGIWRYYWRVRHRDRLTSTGHCGLPATAAPALS
jgi:hypothetical protein